MVMVDLILRLEKTGTATSYSSCSQPDDYFQAQNFRQFGEPLRKDDGNEQSPYGTVRGRKSSLAGSKPGWNHLGA